MCNWKRFFFKCGLNFDSNSQAFRLGCDCSAHSIYADVTALRQMWRQTIKNANVTLEGITCKGIMKQTS